MKKILLFLTMYFALANAQLYYDKHGESRGAYKDSLEYSKLVELANRFRGSILVKKPVEGVKPRKNLEKIPEDKIQRTFNVSRDTLDKENWLEVEKNEIVKICVDEPVVAWETSLKAIISSDSCLAFQTSTLIGVETLRVHFSDAKSSHKINLAVGMKYLDFKNEEVKLGFNKKSKKFWTLDDAGEEDPERFVSITGTYLVDKYPVTNCELIQVLWDSIPATSTYKNPQYRKMHHEDWFARKMASTRNAYCAAHDTIANTVTLYQSMVYANTRSIREGLKPYYIFSVPDDLYLYEGFVKKAYIIGFWDFSGTHNTINIMVTINAKSDGYRLPFYDEWMMLARGGDKEKKAPWGSPATPLNEIQKYARFESSYAMEETSDYISEPVGQLLPNGYGLYDMFGLAAEHVLLKDNRFIGNSDHPSVLKGGELSYGFYDVGASGVGAGFRLIRNIGNNAKWEERGF
ncbi:MAG: SUMF1/EgtB/PvdO family nonheme iron enzyme [Fibrobacter sp.]|uniref:formylglycine-generating enzyme family protein n=1 Tax=Fibrobacter sp. TaxID=35828 RepID=UPI0025C22D5D|nr:SUMF1/EgtB/PvdO family nonheme iron enzyme [Fibrobacter sp.]MBQ7078849.1 SUMF1/EgtB/PvdO family nonheme iron enzyme [Fibrobacter sp.]